MYFPCPFRVLPLIVPNPFPIITDQPVSTIALKKRLLFASDAGYNVRQSPR